jgi:hypothetical protein
MKHYNVKTALYIYTTILVILATVTTIASYEVITYLSKAL